MAAPITLPAPSDYHVHTDNSMDSKTPMTEMCQRAIEIGLTEIAFTDHLNNHLFDVDLGYYNADRYFEDIEICRAKFPALTILAGVEVGEPHRWFKKVQPILERYPYDVVLGSLHWVGQESMFSANYFRSRPIQQAFGAYFTELVQMIDHGGFDILTHVDLPKRVGFNTYNEFDTSMFEDAFRSIWQACIRNNITPEVNTKALRMPVHQLHPTPQALQWYVEMGGHQLTFGSDAHHPDSLAQGFAEANQVAQQVGIHQLCQYRKRQIVGWNVLVQ